VTAGERLTQLSGLSGVSAAVMLLAIGSGATAGAALVDYSGLSSATAEVHLLTDVQVSSTATSAGSGKYRYHDDDIWEYIRVLKHAHRKKPESEVIEKPQKVVSYTTELYDPVVERLVLEIKVARASMRPKADIMELVKQLDDSILSIQEEEDEVIELFLLN